MKAEVNCRMESLKSGCSIQGGFILDNFDWIIILDNFDWIIILDNFLIILEIEFNFIRIHICLHYKIVMMMTS